MTLMTAFSYHDPYLEREPLEPIRRAVSGSLPPQASQAYLMHQHCLMHSFPSFPRVGCIVCVILRAIMNRNDCFLEIRVPRHSFCGFQVTFIQAAVVIIESWGHGERPARPRDASEAHRPEVGPKVREIRCGNETVIFGDGSATCFCLSCLPPNCRERVSAATPPTLPKIVATRQLTPPAQDHQLCPLPILCLSLHLFRSLILITTPLLPSFILLSSTLHRRRRTE